MQTVLLVPVIPHGVLQLGSLEKVRLYYNYCGLTIVSLS